MLEKLPIENLRTLIFYDPILGVLKWKSGRRGGYNIYIYTRKTRANVEIEGRKYAPRELAWALHHGWWPGRKQILSKDGDLTNLKLANLDVPPRGSLRCAECKQIKLETEFSVKRQNSARGRATYCKVCDAVKYPTTKEYSEKARLRKYGLTEHTHTEMLNAQGGVCAICKGTDSRKLSVDHCHATGKVRALLCSLCNSGLGAFRDDPERLLEAARYLLKNK